jgi:hypothetical protein
MSDIAATRDTLSHRRVLAENLVPNRSAFASYEHNLKAFAVAEPASGFPTRSDAMKAVPMALSGITAVDPTKLP